MKNTRLIRAREECGLPQVKAMQLSKIDLCGFENGRTSPVSTVTGDWTELALRVADFYGLPAEYLWPEHQKTLLDVPDVFEYPAPDEALERAEGDKALRDSLTTLTQREQKILQQRLGFNKDWEGMTLDEIAQKHGVGRERIRQIEAKALRKLRHPSRANKIKLAVWGYARRSDMFSHVETWPEYVARMDKVRREQEARAASAAELARQSRAYHGPIPTVHAECGCYLCEAARAEAERRGHQLQAARLAEFENRSIADGRKLRERLKSALQRNKRGEFLDVTKLLDT